MKIGIIIHSQTGNTLSVANQIKERLSAAGYSVELEQVTAVDEKQPDPSKIKLKTVPETAGYDYLIFGAPVHGASLSPVMKVYLSQVQSLEGKKTICFMTEFFPYAWMGGNRAVGQMKAACSSKGANVVSAGVVNWSNRKRAGMIQAIVEKAAEETGRDA